MNDFTGRPRSNRARNIGKGILEGLSALGTAMADAPKRQRIEEIDKTILNLQQERDHLIADLIEPGDLKVSESYDPYWRKPVVEEEHDTSKSIFGEGRLTQCKGRTTSSRYHEAHPGCPYVEQIHTKHEFTLRD